MHIYYTTEKTVAKIRSLNPAARYIAGFGIIAVGYVVMRFMHGVIPMKLLFGKLSYEKAGLDDYVGMLMRVGVFAAAGLLIMALLLIMPSKKLLFSYIGANSLQIFIYHMGLVIALSDSGLLRPVIDSYLGFALTILAALALTFALSPTPLGAPFRLIAKGTRKLVKCE